MPSVLKSVTDLMRVANKLALIVLAAWGHAQPPARAAWSGFDRPKDNICTLGSPLPNRYAAVIISGRFEVGSGRGKPIYSLVFTADDGSPEITKLDVSVDEQEIVRFDSVSHVPAAPGGSAVVAVDTDTLATLLRATDTGKVLHLLVPPVHLSYDFDLEGFAKAADTFTDCMLHNVP